MKEYSVELGGAQHALRYTLTERKELEKRYAKGLRELILTDVYPLDEKNEPTGGGLIERQIAFLFMGIRHKAGPKFTEQKLEGWIDDAVLKGGHMLIYLTHAVRAAMASGVLGYVIEASEEPEEEKGKAEASPE